MFGRYWLHFSVIVGLTLFLGTLFYFQPNESDILDRYPNAKTEQCERGWSYEIQGDREVGIRLLAVPICKGAKEKPGNSDDYDDELHGLPPELFDLLAQERMAYWTFWIACLTAFGLGAIFWTLWDTQQTLEATRSLNDITDKISALELSSYVSVEKPRITFTERGNVIVRFEISNRGQIPAEILRYRVQRAFLPHGGHIKDMPNGREQSLSRVAMETSMVIPGGSSRYFSFLFEGPTLPEGWYCFPFATSQIDILVGFFIQWRDALSQGPSGIKDWTRTELRNGEILTDEHELFHWRSGKWDGSDPSFEPHQPQH